MAGRALSWLLWRCLLAATVVLSSGCHLMFGSFETKDTADGPVSLVGVCDKGTFRCKEEVLLACSPDQRSWVRKDVCASSSQCDSKNGVCTICQQADMMRCSGSSRESCSTDRASWTVVDKCPSAETCSPNGCGPCTVPGALQCALDSVKGEVLKECDPKTGFWVDVATCPNDVVCMASLSLAQTQGTLWDRKCEGKCPPGQAMCEGSTLLRCPSSGLDWMSLAMCANEPLCQATLSKITKSTDMGATIDTCDQGCGTPGTARCTGNVLERCSADRLSWQPVMECQTGLQCSTTGEGGCILCTPGEFQCNGQFLEQCSATHVWERKDDCLQPALCSLAADANGAVTVGSCRDPVCPRPGTYTCASPTDPKVTPGPGLFFCDTDQTANGLRDTCATEQLCNGPDGECKEPACAQGQRRCGPTNTLEVQVCNIGRTGFDTVATCAAGEFCDPTDAAQPCKHECPAALFCNDRFLMACSSAQGVTQRAECQTRELCDCGLNKTCPAGTLPDGCGVPVCGENLANFRCTDSAGTAAQGPLLQACKTGRDGWATTTAQNCTSPALCYPGPAPYYTNGYCATCPIAGEVACDPTATTTRTCSTDRKSWTNQMPCGFGCVVDPSTTDYCAACAPNELRCSGDLSQLLSCSTDRKSTPVNKDCPFGCVNSGIADYCGTCAVGEKRCSGSAPGSLLQTCNAAQTDVGTNVTCANGCINSGLADYCSDCVVGTTQCSGAGVRTCGADGHWGAVSACTNGCVATSTGADYCGGCSANELRCSGTTLQQCAADQRSLSPLRTCTPEECIDSGMADFCAACGVGERRCSGATLQQCTADRMGLTTVGPCDYGCIEGGMADYCAACGAGELRCDGDTLRTCMVDQTGLIDSMNCTSGCYDNGTADYCRDCRPGQTRCATGGMQTCGANGRWGAATACPNATSCYGTSPTAYCGDCNPGDRRCSNSTVLTCDSVGRWPASSTEDCQRGCIDSGNADYCAECNSGDTSCSGSMLLTCNAATGRYATTGSNCAMGCFGTTPAAACGVCNGGDSQCSASGSTRQVCSNGRFSDVESCTNGCINDGTDDFCAVCPMGAAECVMNGTSRRTCVDGVWTAATPCPNQACVGTDCAACSPNATQCAAGDPTSVRTCSSAGAWGTPMVCPNRACAHDVCVDCMPNSTDCADDTDLITCSSQGSWGAPSPCPTMACVGTACADCQPDARECVDSVRQRTCDATGHWVTTNCVDQGQVACVGMACAECMPRTKQCTATGSVRTCSADGTWLANQEACTYGCEDNGDADFCIACPDGRSECVDTTMIRTCDGTWMTMGCQSGCFDAPDPADDYCRECALGATDCRTDTQATICNALGHWADGDVCANYCLKGSCVDCRPGSTMCTEDATGLLTCSEVGSWSATAEDCPNGCANDGAKDACVLL